MFQYAAGKALSTRLNDDFYLDLRSYKNYQLHSYELRKMRISAYEAKSSHLRRWPNYLELPNRGLNRMGIKTHWYVEPAMAYDLNWSTLPKDRLISGNFQSEKYFSEISNTLKKEFLPKNSISRENLLLQQKILQSDSVMIHIRRGDYVTNAKTLEIHGVCGLDYYTNAMAMVESHISKPKYFVFSNDLIWAKKNLTSRHELNFVDGNAFEPVEDLRLMSSCRHHIIANSTFSWWAAWLSDVQESIVVAPKKWFATDRYYTGDIVPSRWSRI